MVFLHPEYLWGLLGLFVPIIIHLFDFRKNRKVYFSDIRFLKQVKHASKKPLKLKQWLILLSRMGAIAFLVFVFAQPLLPENESNSLRQGNNLIYIDNSESMSTPANVNESVLDQARTLGQSIAKKVSRGEGIIIVNNDDLTQFWSPITAKEASDYVASLSFSNKPLSLTSFAISLNEYKKQGALGEVFIVSDFQKSSMLSLNNPLDTSLYYQILPLTMENTTNCVVDSVFRLPSDIESQGEVNIGVIVRNTGKEPKIELPVKVYLGERQVASAAVNIPAFQTKEVVFSLGKERGNQFGYVQIDDYPVSFDNQFYFAINKQQPLYILTIEGQQPSGYIQQVFGNKELFRLEQMDWRNVDISKLRNADFIILNQIEQPNKALMDAINARAQSVGNVLVVPPQNPDLKSYKLLANNLSRTNFVKQRLQAPPKNDPYFSKVLENTRATIDMPEATSVWSWGIDRSAILSFEDNRPYLSQISKGIYFLSSPLIDSLSGFQTHALFVPVMYQLAFQNTSPQEQLFERVGKEFVEVEIDSIDIKDIVKLKRDEMEIIPDKMRSGSKWRLILPENITRAGIYQLMINGVSRGALAFNSEVQESFLEQSTNNQLSDYFEGYHYSILENINPSSKTIGNIDRGITLWKYALVICLLFLLTEALLIRFL